MKTWIKNAITWIAAGITIAVMVFVPVTIIAWCVQFWVLLFS